LFNFDLKPTILKNILKNIGPGTLVAAAFIGPGTVTVCSLAGVEQGFTLLWAMLLAILTTVVLQEMAARLGLVSGQGLAAGVKAGISSPGLRYAAIILILAAVLIGNAAYEAGNISGGVLALDQYLSPWLQEQNLSLNYLAIPVGLIVFTLLYSGNYRLIERILVVVVLFMSVSFILTAILTRPELGKLIKGLLIPVIPEKGWLNVVGLVGTTVVPYNLFLHASAVRNKWEGPDDLRAARRDTYVSVALGGLVSIAIIISGAALKGNTISSGAELAQGLVPLYGDMAGIMLSLGLFAAGITSAITAPLAAAYVAQECFNWSKDLRSTRFRLVWLAILVLGVLFAVQDFSPVEVIRFAQVTNGLLLPLMAGFLLWLMNSDQIPAPYKNTVRQNLLGLLIVVVALMMGFRTLLKVFG